jgi:hypothetical protein
MNVVNWQNHRCLFVIQNMQEFLELLGDELVCFQFFIVPILRDRNRCQFTGFSGFSPPLMSLVVFLAEPKAVDLLVALVAEGDTDCTGSGFTRHCSTQGIS